MATVNYTYLPCKFELQDRIVQALERVKGEYTGELYWLGQNTNASGTLLELSTCGKRYRYAYVDKPDSTHVESGSGTVPMTCWLNPEAILHRDKQPLPFSWRS